MREKYSRDAFDHEQKKAELTHRDAQNMQYDVSEGRGLNKSSEIIKQLMGQEIEAKQKMQKLYEIGQKEASELSKEYDRLTKNVEEAVKALQDFRREKLGMEEKSLEEENK